MKKFHIYSIFALLLIFSACETDLLRTTIGDGTPPVLNTSESEIILEHTDSAEVALTLNWTNPGYLNDTKNGDIVGTYIIEIDKNQSFSKPKIISLVNSFEKLFNVYELNKILLDLECETGVENSVFVQVKSVFFSTDTLLSNLEKLTVTPYSTVIPPAIAVPDEVWISGEALTTGWNAPFLPEQQFTKETETTFSITIDLVGGKSYEMITDGTGSNWTPCYRIDPVLNPADMIWEGTFVWDGNGSDYGWGSLLFQAPPNDGTYKITLDFQNATFTVLDVTGPPAIAVPDELYIVGDALTVGWNTPLLPEQKFEKISDTKFSIIIGMLASKDYEMITDGQGSNWTPCYRIDPAKDPAEMVFSGSFVWDGDGSDYSWGSKKFLSPDTDGDYKITMDFQSATYVVVKQ